MWVTPGAHSAGRQVGLLRRTGIIIPAIGVGAFLVAIVAVVAYLVTPSGSGATALSQFMSSLPNSGSIVAMEAERQQIILMSAASKTFSIAAQPATVDPASVVAASQAAVGGSSSSAGTDVPLAPAPDPGSAQQIAYNMLPSFGFNQTTQYSCLVSLWNRESGWRWDAENPSGAYGIPQALPGSKMASAGADWQTNPATQIKWGLGYISQVYGTPCNAWAHEEAVGSY